MKLDLTSAMDEVQNKSEKEIEYETAVKWAARSIACFRLAFEAKETGNMDKYQEWIFRGEDMYRESLEHGSLVEDHGLTVSEVQDEVLPYKNLAKGY